mmetsp:Transcript_9843/g.16193  ORF Transcript_9843/g.16193 Transcript_9843/m.16193 type:complete len:2349 (-) Transcript_9843:1208-8254(-)
MVTTSGEEHSAVENGEVLMNGESTASRNTQKNGIYDASEDDAVAKYVRKSGGNKPIRKILIANNGIAAVKAIRSIRKWAYETFGNERQIQFVVMATPEDIKVNAEYIRLADEFVEVPGGSNNNNYANVSLIVDIAEQTQSDAVWAGWGHASENPRLPDNLGQTLRKISFIGPGGAAMRALGDKIGSTLIAQSANVSTVAWSGSGLTIDYEKEGIPDDIYQKSCVHSAEEAERSAEKIGYPIMIKASEGGGGKGIRKVNKKEQVASSYRAVQGEVPGSPIFIMKLCSNSRHLEVQLVADAYGQAIALYGRDCSVQRRHQKIMEEGPVTAASEELWLEMERAAVRLAKTVGYVSCGTVEYLYVDNGYFFLELNPRLQVEHPVTEWISDVNLPATQLMVAMGIPLHRIPSIRRMYGEDPSGDSPIDFDTHPRRPAKGHVIASRITAENPDEGFQPTSGAIQELNFRSTPSVWGYFSVSGSGGIHEFSDSQFGHLFAWGETREYARKNLVCALKELSIHGEIRTTIEYLIKLLETKDYIDNHIDTTWLDKLIAEKITADKPDVLLAVMCGALQRAWSASKACINEFQACLERGQAPPKHASLISFAVDLIYEDLKYSFLVSRCCPQTFKIVLNNSSVLTEVRPLSDGGLLILINGKSHVCYAKEEISGLRLVIDGKTCLFPKEYDPTQLRAQMTGKLVRHLLEDGAHVSKGQSYAEIEVMKMYMPLVTPESGTIHYAKNEGAVLDAGDLIAVLTLDDPTKVRRAAPFEGSLPPMKPPRVMGDKWHQIMRNSLYAVRMIMAGYDNRPEALGELIAAVQNPELPLLEFNEVLSAVSSRIPPSVHDDIEAVLNCYRRSIPLPRQSSVPNGLSEEEDAGAGQVIKDIETAVIHIKDILDTHAARLHVKSEKDSYVANTIGLYELCRIYAKGLPGRLIDILTSALREYISVEQLFNQGKNDEDVIEELREQNRNSLSKVVDIIQSHREFALKSKVVVGIEDFIATNHVVEDFVSVLHELAALTGKNYSEVALKARQLLISYQTPSYEQRRVIMEKVLREADVDTLHRRDLILPVVNQSDGTFDVLVPFFRHPDPAIAFVAMEVYVRRAYQAYDIPDLTVTADGGIPRAEWDFILPGFTLPNPAPANPSRGRFGKMPTFDSADNLLALQQHHVPTRHGMLVAFSSVEDLQHDFPTAVELYVRSVAPQRDNPSAAPVNVLDVALVWDNTFPSEQYFIDTFSSFLRSFEIPLRRAGVKLVTFLVSRDTEYPSIFTFRERLNYAEDPIYRHILPPLAYELELKRLSNFTIAQYPSNTRNIHLYFAEEKISPGQKRRGGGDEEGGASSLDIDRRFFVRALVRQAAIYSSQNEAVVSIPEAERVFTDALKVLEVAISDAKYRKTENNHLFLNVLPDIIIDLESVAAIIKRIHTRYAMRLVKLRISTVELKLNTKSSPDSSRTQLRFVASNPTGHVLRVDGYVEVKDPVTGNSTFTAIGEDYAGQQQSLTVTAPYPILNLMQRKRIQAHSIGTSYVYDFIELFEKALQELWKSHTQQRRDKGYRRKKAPLSVLKAVELILSPDGTTLVETNRPPGQNDIGMVAWRVTLYTPEYPDEGGRTAILIANDITFMSGSFGPKEDTLFCLASEQARKLRVPRIYLAANSGARIGLASEVKDVFSVEWNDPLNPSKGFKYLYLDEATYRTLSERKSVQCEPVDVTLEDGQVERRYKIVDIIGAQHGLGVENLSGSGMIAGETSHAYDDIFTLTFVTARTVGIGAYLVRLGQRVIQNRGPGPIILTGFSALNKVLGRDVYTSNMQIGGTKIMFANGVSHLTVKDDLEGVSSILVWLSYIPQCKGAPLPVVETTDPITRPVAFLPTKQAYDPRHMLGGVTDSNGEWTSGFFDKGSWVETLAGWAKTVVTGRARLGGIPMGVISVETRTMDQVTPADPANPLSQQTIVQQAGQVWFPDSAYKTAQAIQDFDREGLPLIIFANWRGFSGGMRDMFDEILKFGSYIVDFLRVYKQPVMVYLPPGGELRGGAWVVIDSKINPEMVEMYADPEARGGVLEPQGIVEIKFRKRDLLLAMQRLDQKLKDLYTALKEPVSGLEGEARRRELKRDIEQREEELLPIYNSIAVQFADLHDTPGRMKAKGVIEAVVPWKSSREYFYWRIRRRVAELGVRDQIAKARPGLSYAEVTQLLMKWLQQYDELDRGASGDESSDQEETEQRPRSNIMTGGGRTESVSGVTSSDNSAAQRMWNDDQRVIQWIEEDEINVNRRIKGLRHLYLQEQVAQLAREDTEATVAGLLSVIRSIDPADTQRRDSLLESLRLMIGTHMSTVQLTPRTMSSGGGLSNSASSGTLFQSP